MTDASSRSMDGDCAGTEVDPTIAASGVRNSCETDPISASRRLSACARSLGEGRTVTAIRPVMAATVMKSMMSAICAGLWTRKS